MSENVVTGPIATCELVFNIGRMVANNVEMLFPGKKILKIVNHLLLFVCMKC